MGLELWGGKARRTLVLDVGSNQEAWTISSCRIKVCEQWKDEAGRGSVGAAPLVAPRLHVRWSVSFNG